MISPQSVYEPHGSFNGVSELPPSRRLSSGGQLTEVGAHREHNVIWLRATDHSGSLHGWPCETVAVSRTSTLSLTGECGHGPQHPFGLLLGAIRTIDPCQPMAPGAAFHQWGRHRPNEKQASTNRNLQNSFILIQTDGPMCEWTQRRPKSGGAWYK